MEVTGEPLIDKTKDRRCSQCKEVKPLEQFYWQKRRGRVERRWTCIACHNLRSKKDYKARHPEVHNRSQRRAHVFRTFGITQEEYDAILHSQGGVCAICGGEETVQSSRGVRHSLAVDHDHVTGTVRGILCRRCNTGLGSFRDSPELLEIAIHYLQREEA